MTQDAIGRLPSLLAEWKRLEDAFHDNLPDQGETGDPAHGKALCQFLYDNSEYLRILLTALDGDEVVERVAEALFRVFEEREPPTEYRLQGQWLVAARAALNVIRGGSA